MILRVNTLGPLDWANFTPRWVEGGLVTTPPVWGPPVGGLAGVPRRRRLQTPTKQARPRTGEYHRGRPLPFRRGGRVRRFIRRTARRFRHGSGRGLNPQIWPQGFRPWLRMVRGWTRGLTLQRRRLIRVGRAFSWPHHRRSGVHSLMLRHAWAREAGRLRGVVFRSPLRLGDDVRDYFWRVVGRRRRGAWRAAQADQIARPRWAAPWRSTANSPDLIRRDWLRPVPTLPALRPGPGGREAALSVRLAQLHRAVGVARAARQRGVRAARAGRWLFKRLARQHPRPSRRYLRAARRRVRRRLAHPTRAGKPLRRLTRWSLPRLHLFRPALLEVAALVTPTGWLGVAHQARLALQEGPAPTVLEYSWLDQYDHLERNQRRFGQGRRQKIRDHPDLGPRYREAYQVRHDWLYRGAVLGRAQRARVDPRERRPTHTAATHPGAHPLTWGPWSWLYWSAARWARGSYWRTRPTGRARWVFADTVGSGYAIEAESRNWYTGAAAATLARAAITAEEEFLRLHPPVDPLGWLPSGEGLPGVHLWWWRPPPTPPVHAPFVPAPYQPEPPIVWLEAVARHNRARQLTALAQGRPNLVQWWRARHQAYLVRRRRWRWFVRNARGVARAGRRTLANMVYLGVLPFRWVVQLGWWAARPALIGWDTLVGVVQMADAAQKQYIRELCWSYPPTRRAWWALLAWRHAYAADDFADEALNPEIDLSEVDSEDGEIDTVHDYGEDQEALGAYWGALHPTGWDHEWWPADEDDYFSESAEVLADLAFEEVPYYIRLGLRPVVDLVVRLPVWAALEAVTTGWVWAKREWQLWWGARLLGRYRWGWAWAKRVVHVGVWLGVYTTWLGLLAPDELELWVTYTCGWTFHEEYYLVWVALGFLGTTWVVGPHPLREYLVRELGPSNVGFALLGGVTLATPEDYYPQRPWNTPGRVYAATNVGRFHWKDWRRFPSAAHQRGAHGSTYPGFTYDDARVVVAHFGDAQSWIAWNHWDRDLGVYVAPDRPENEDNPPGWPLLDDSGEHFFWHRHPWYYRNSYMFAGDASQDDLYEVDCFEPYFMDDLENTPRNEALYHQVPTRAYSGHLTAYPPVTRPDYLPYRPE